MYVWVVQELRFVVTIAIIWINAFFRLRLMYARIFFSVALLYFHSSKNGIFVFYIHIHVLHQLSYSTRVSRKIIRSNNNKTRKKMKIAQWICAMWMYRHRFRLFEQVWFLWRQESEEKKIDNGNELWHRKLLMFFFFSSFSLHFSINRLEKWLYTASTVWCSFFVT